VTDDEAEEIVCDTTFVSVVQSASHPKSQAVIAGWPAAVSDRLNRAILGISVISLAELRSGHLASGWGATRIARAERIINAYLWFPLDLDVVEKCAALRAKSLRNGWNCGDNDLWIAATAQSRGCAVVSCDLGFCRIEGIDLIYLPGATTAPQDCPTDGVDPPPN
jgi:predicted nucleic acid-binding protein